MKKRRLIPIFSVALAIVIIIVLFYTVLVLRKVQIVFLDSESNIITTPEKFSNIDIDGIFSSFYGRPILFLSKNEMADKAKGIDAYIKVVDIVKEFPNKAVIYLAVRNEIFSFSYDDKKYCMDKEGVILAEIPVNEHRIDISNSMNAYIQRESVVIGGKLKFIDSQAWRLEIFYDISEYLWSIFIDYDTQKQVVNLIEVSDSDDVTRLIIGEANCLEFVIIDPRVRLIEKLECALGVYYALSEKSNIQLRVSISDADNKAYCVQSPLDGSNFM